MILSSLNGYECHQFGIQPTHQPSCPLQLLAPSQAGPCQAQLCRTAAPAGATMEDELPTANWSSCHMGALIFVTGLSLFNFSYSASNIGGVLLYLDSAHTDCSHEAICLHSSLWKGILVSSCLVGAFFGALFAGPLADHFGRRTTLLTNNFFFIVGSLSSALSPGIQCLVVSRCVVGIGVGIASALVHVYIGEVVPAGRRGEHGAILVMMGTSGILVANLVCWAISDWRWVFALGVVPALLQVIWGSAIMPESSLWYRQRPKSLAMARRSFQAVALGSRLHW